MHNEDIPGLRDFNTLWYATIKKKKNYAEKVLKLTDDATKKLLKKGREFWDFEIMLNILQFIDDEREIHFSLVNLPINRTKYHLN